MGLLLIKLALAPALVAAATLTAQRWGPRAGGMTSAFPAIVGPVLLIVALEHGAAAAARTANGVLLGSVGLAAFALVYGRSATRRGWAISLAAGWMVAAAGTGLVGILAAGSGPPTSGVIAVAALLIAARCLPSAGASAERLGLSGRRLLERMAAAAVLVAGLSAAVGAFGATAGGMLAALPVVTSLLAVFTHREAGGGATLEILRGTLVGMTGFVVFCQVVAATIVPYGPAIAFAVATMTALLLQAAIARCAHAVTTPVSGAPAPGPAAAEALGAP